MKQKLEAKVGTEICMCQEGQEAQLQAFYQNKGPRQAKGFYPTHKNIIGITVDKVQVKKADPPTQEDVGLNLFLHHNLHLPTKLESWCVCPCCWVGFAFAS